MSAEVSICDSGGTCSKEPIFGKIQEAYPGFVRESCNTILAQVVESNLTVETNCGLDALLALLKAVETTMQPPQGE